MTPYLNPKIYQEEHFNPAHRITWCIIKRTFGLLKRRFHVLHSEVTMAPDRVCTIVAACSILHNTAVNLWEPDPEDCDKGDEGCPANRQSQSLAKWISSFLLNSRNFWKFLECDSFIPESNSRIYSGNCFPAFASFGFFEKLEIAWIWYIYEVLPENDSFFPVFISCRKLEIN